MIGFLPAACRTSIIAPVNNYMLFITDKTLPCRGVHPGCFLSYIKWTVTVGLSSGQIPKTLVMFQPKDFGPCGCGNRADLHKPGGERESSCLPGLKLTEAAVLPPHPIPPPTLSLGLFCNLAGGNCQPEIFSAVVLGQVTRGQTALEDDRSTTTIRTSSP